MIRAEGIRAHEAPESPKNDPPRRVADRYEVLELLGKGGMAVAHRALDVVTGRHVALKLLLETSDEKRRKEMELFEREYQTLVQLAHPRVVQVFEYGLDAGAPYYTMELLDGGDLQTLAPMRWQDAATAAYEICSALSMLHSRRLVHRDLTPRNIRRTADGKAKLIDFGLLSPMGPPSLLAGTPPFVAPELVNWISLDGRSDLFSLGATMYFVLTGRHAFPARRIDQLRDVWRTSPAAPSKLVSGIPRSLDELVLAMLRIDAGSRPKNAAEVMERLLPLLERTPDDELRVVTAHLTTPRLVGRNDVIERFRKRVLGAARRRGGGFVVSGEAGMGRTRMLDAFALEAKLAGATTVRADASNAGVPFGVAATLAARLHAAAPATTAMAARSDATLYATLFRSADAGAVPGDKSTEGSLDELVDLTRTNLDPGTLQVALRKWLLELCSLRPIAIAVDDFDRIDEPSAALLASLTWEAPRHRFVYAFSIATGATTRATAVEVVQKHGERVELRPLTAPETTELLGSIFGETANLQLLSSHLHTLCAGRPRDCMTLAQYLVDQGVIRYSGGAFTLPGEIERGMLPESLESAFAEQVSRLSPLARRLAALVSLEMTDRLSRTQLLGLAGATVGAVDAALGELLAMRLLSGDAGGYSLRERSLSQLLTAGLTEAALREMHQVLAKIGGRPVSTPLPAAYHLLLGNRPEEGLELILPHTIDSDARTVLSVSSMAELGGDRTGRTLRLALSEVMRLGRPRRELQSFWVMLAGIGALGEDASLYYDVPAEWLEQLKRDTGWYEWQAFDPSLEPATRAMMALGAAGQRYAALPEADRGLSPPDALRQLVGYVVFSIAVAVRVLDLELQETLPQLLEPFAPLDPMVAAMLANAKGTLLNGLGKREAAREVFEGVVRDLDGMGGALAYVAQVRAAISQTLAEIDASVGVSSFWTERLDRDALDLHQQVGARYVQKVAALQKGDWEAAERYRQQAELTMLQSLGRPMFSTLGQELEAHAMARDITGLRQVRSAIASMAEKHPGWALVLSVADAQYQRLCGDLDGALATLAAGRAAWRGRVRSPWLLQAAAVEAELLVELARPGEALDVALPALAECERDGMRYYARALAGVVALAEGKLGDPAGALSRLDGVIAEQLSLGVTGLALGRSYEHSARLAIWAGDPATFERFASLTAAQYRPGESSVLGALYERLMEEARQAGIGVEATVIPLRHDPTSGHTSRESVTSAMAGCTDRRARGERALSLLCGGDPPRRGHLFLIGDAGLELIASNEPVDDAASLRSFALGRLEAETAPENTVTAAAVTVASPSVSFTWYAPDGASFTTVMLAAHRGSAVVIAGVLVLAEGGSRSLDFDDMAAAVARAALESGDARGVRAA